MSIQRHVLKLADFGLARSRTSADGREGERKKWERKRDSQMDRESERERNREEQRE